MSAQSTIDPAGMDFLSFVFEGTTGVDRTKNVYIDAEDPSRALNGNQTRTLVRKLIAGFKANGLEKGDSVLLLLPNNFLYSTIFFGIVGAGGVCMGANPASQSFEIEHLSGLAKPKFIISSHENLPKLMKATESPEFTATNIFALDAKTFPLSIANNPLSIITSTGKEAGQKWQDFTHLTEHGQADWIRFTDLQTAKTTSAAMFPTSGTSGLPKAAILSHYTLINQHLNLEVAPLYNVSRLISLPFFHMFASQQAHTWPIRNGQPCYVLPRFQQEQFLDALQKYSITDTLMAPPIVLLLNKASSTFAGRLESLRWIGVGGAPIDPEEMKLFESHLHPTATLSQVYGMTEIGVAACVRFPERQCWGSVGRTLPGYEIQLVDASGAVIDADDVAGTCQVRSKGLMVGYKNKEPHPEGGWYDTGDIMKRAGGKFYIVGRSKELIKVNGWQVPPAELEAVLLTMPGVKEAGVVGVPKGDGVSELPRAYVVRADSMEGALLTSESVFDYSRSRLASYKALKGGVKFIENMPRTASGKIQRFKLLELDQAGRPTDAPVEKPTVVEATPAVIAEVVAQVEAIAAAPAVVVKTGPRMSPRLTPVILPWHHPVTRTFSWKPYSFEKSQAKLDALDFTKPRLGLDIPPRRIAA